ncbi:MAG: hypothetical protein IKB05_02790 [Alphaproteobacteria bacterium]|nr:hypothetical protein [Alphaproteobacteria bacterium]
MIKKLFLVIGFVLAVSPVWAVPQLARFADPSKDSFEIGSGYFPNQMMHVYYTEFQSGTPNQAVVQGRCAAVSGSAYDTKQIVELKNEATAYANKYCWCQLIFPFVSSYIFSPLQRDPGGAMDFPNAAVCSRYCALNCVNNVELFYYQPMDLLYN